MQAHLRIEAAEEHLRFWLQANSAGKSVLAQSATHGGRKSKKAVAGEGVYPLIVAMRTAMKEVISEHPVGPSSALLIVADMIQRPIEAIERILLLLKHLELRCQSPTLDYSAVGILAENMKQELNLLPKRDVLLDLVERSIQHVKTSSGLAQPEVWALFRRAFEAKPIPRDILEACDACSDPSKILLADCLIASESRRIACDLARGLGRAGVAG